MDEGWIANPACRVRSRFTHFMTSFFNLKLKGLTIKFLQLKFGKLRKRLKKFDVSVSERDNPKLRPGVNFSPVKADTHEGFCALSMLQAHFEWSVHMRGHTARACSMLCYTRGSKRILSAS